MAFTSIMTTEAEIDQKTGSGVSASYTDTMKTAAGLQAESFINILMRINFSDKVTAGLNADVKGIFSDFVSSRVAIEAISYDMSGYGSRVEAEDKINILRDSNLSIMSLLRDKKFTTFISGA